MSRNGSVLLVDDDPDMTAMYRLGLEGHGFEVIVLHDASELNQVVAREQPDVVVLDWEMPGMRGDEALERLRRSDAGREVAVFMLSNFPGTKNGAIDRVFGAGALAWLEKVNTTPDHLAERLREAIGPA